MDLNFTLNQSMKLDFFFWAHVCFFGYNHNHDHDYDHVHVHVHDPDPDDNDD